MTRAELIEMVNEEITGGCSLPYSVPEREMERIINQALNWFYVNYGPSVETQYYIIPRDIWTKPEFKKTRTLLLPDCVISVYEVREMNGAGRLGTIDADFYDNRLLAAELFLSPFASDDLVLRTAQYSYWDLTQAFILERVSYDFNRNTHRLKIIGRNPKRDCAIYTYVKIEENRLYDDWFFQRYIAAQAKMSLGRILGFFTFNLPGGITINADSIKQEGADELEKILARIDEENSPDWFYIFHSFAPWLVSTGVLGAMFM